MIGFAVWIAIKIKRFLTKRKKFSGDTEGLAWAKTVLDPDGPIRPTFEDVKKYRYAGSHKDKYIQSQRDD